jgi:NADH:ubiquinone oxidoreductase subunit 2 (subunit N)
MTIIVVMSLATLYYYLRMCYSRFITLHDETKWGPQTLKVNKTIAHGVILSSVSIIGLIVCTIVTNIN